MTTTIVMVSYRALADQVDTARREISRLIATVRAIEPDRGGITMLQDTDDPARMTLIERWPSRELFLGPHLRQPPIRSFTEVAGTFLAGPPDISFWHHAGDA